MQKEKIIKYYLGKFSVLFIGSSGNLDQCFKHGSASAQPGKPPSPFSLFTLSIVANNFFRRRVTLRKKSNLLLLYLIKRRITQVSDTIL